ncbi:MAG: Yop proteins translocation protein L [Candidatus Anoxychlamydiales bacterium]|nr:Yop proteins translocation protein L [Candidatus Anoxychlamydiales bacterium]NGX40734.1 Yop proteins translocation protein L [Candidatus Anoxychlamydiales bacterium]
MKFFSFLKEEIHPEPGEKIIPKEEFSKLIEANEIVEKAKGDVVIYKEKIKKECETLKEEAKKEGFDEGLKSLNEHILKLDKTAKELSKKYEEKILPIALKAAKKIVSEELKMNPEAIVNIIKGALKPVAQHVKVKIFVNKQDLEILEKEKEKEKIKEILQITDTFTIEERNDIEPGGCIIETEKGIINAQLENQFRAIEAAFKAFSKK